MSDLVLERQYIANATTVIGPAAFAPMVGEDYWRYRVRLTERQAVLGFPKYSTIGIGFAVEEDWNTNLPYTSMTRAIREHIWHNRGDESITQAQVDEAISMIQAAVLKDIKGLS